MLLCAFIRSEKKSEPSNIAEAEGFVSVDTHGGERETSLKNEFDRFKRKVPFLIQTSLNSIVSYMARYTLAINSTLNEQNALQNGDKEILCGWNASWVIQDFFICAFYSPHN